MTTTTETKAFATEYAAVVESIRPWAPAWLLDLKAAAMAEFRERGFPTSRDEAWRFTPIAPIVETEFVPAPIGPAALEDVGYGFSSGSITVAIVGGEPVIPHGEALPPGLSISRLSDLAASKAAWLIGAIGKTAPFARHPFAALNAALFRDAVVIHVADNAVIETPIALCQMTLATDTDGPLAAHPRVLFVAGRNSQATLVEWYAGPAGEVYLTNTATEVVVGQNASVKHYRIQDESVRSYHVGMLGTRLARDARYVNVAVTLGGAISRTDIQATIEDDGVECTLDGLYVADERRLVDSHTFLDHAKPICTSHQVYKGVLNGRGRGVFNGRILVRPDAQKTDAKQSNQALLLSDDAVINTQPQLEIFADDVRCTHGATVGQLEQSALFYLRQRGIPAAEARGMLIHAFAGDIVDRIDVEPVRDWLSGRLLELGV